MEPTICNDSSVEVAPTIHNFIGNGETFKRLIENQEADDDVNNHFNYLLRCTDGLFKGKFLYINTTEDGESFGSGNPDEHDLTMYIETSCLSARHAEIKFEGTKYLLKDCNSDSGTWVRVGNPCDSKEFSQSTGFTGVSFGDIDLYKESKLRMFRAGSH